MNHPVILVTSFMIGVCASKNYEMYRNSQCLKKDLKDLRETEIRDVPVDAKIVTTKSDE